jgi:flagellar motility protein MotE (MotC chaperone)
MESIRAGISGELEGQKKSNEEKVLKMVSVFESMSPKSAAGVLETLDDWLAVDVLKKMDVKRVAKIMNIMDKPRSAKLSELMTGYYRPSSAANKKNSGVGAEGRSVASEKNGQAKSSESKKGG